MLVTRDEAGDTLGVGMVEAVDFESVEERVMARVNREVARIQAEMLRHDAVIAATNRQLHRQEVEEMVMALALS